MCPPRAWMLSMLYALLYPKDMSPLNLLFSWDISGTTCLYTAEGDLQTSYVYAIACYIEMLPLKCVIRMVPCIFHFPTPQVPTHIEVTPVQ